MHVRETRTARPLVWSINRSLHKTRRTRTANSGRREPRRHTRDSARGTYTQSPLLGSGLARLASEHTAIARASPHSTALIDRPREPRTRRPPRPVTRDIRTITINGHGHTTAPGAVRPWSACFILFDN